MLTPMSTPRAAAALPPPTLAALRASMRASMRGPVRASQHVLAFGDPRVDGCLPGGGLPLGQLHEIAGEGIEAETAAAPAGFAACLLARIAPARPIFWIAAMCDLHAPGLLSYNLDPDRVIMVQTGGDAATLGAMEAALRAGAAGAVLGEVGKLGRTPSRRLQLACLRHGVTGFVLRRWPYGQSAGRRSADREASVAVTRWRVAPAPSRLPTPREPAPREPGDTRWDVTLSHARGGLEGAWLMELDGPSSEGGIHATHPLRVVAELADAAAPEAGCVAEHHAAAARRAGAA
jgi:protein ImuA